jgi:hypothetical protein
MLIITTIYYAEVEPIRKPSTGTIRITEEEESQLRNANRKVVTVYQGTSRG